MQAQLCRQQLQTTVLILHRLQPLRLAHIHPADDLLFCIPALLPLSSLAQITRELQVKLVEILGSRSPRTRKKHVYSLIKA